MPVFLVFPLVVIVRSFECDWHSYTYGGKHVFDDGHYNSIRVWWWNLLESVIFAACEQVDSSLVRPPNLNFFPQSLMRATEEWLRLSPVNNCCSVVGILNGPTHLTIVKERLKKNEIFNAHFFHIGVWSKERRLTLCLLFKFHPHEDIEEDIRHFFSPFFFASQCLSAKMWRV